MTPEAKASIVADLQYLRAWLNPQVRNWRDDPPHEEVRRGSVILKRLVADRELVRAWQAAGFEKEPSVAALDLMATVQARGTGSPEFALAGAARYNAASFDNIPVRKHPQAGAREPSHFRVYSLSEYLESPSIVMGRAILSRREVIRYMASKADLPQAKSAKARRQEQELAERVSRLEAKANEYRPDALMLELISIGQTVAQTPDVVKLMEALSAT